MKTANLALLLACASVSAANAGVLFSSHGADALYAMHVIVCVAANISVLAFWRSGAK